MPGTFQASSIGCYKMCEKFWTLPAQPHDVSEVHSTEFATPFVKGRIRDATLTAQINYAHSCLGLPQHPRVRSSVNLLRFILVPLCQEH